MESRYFIVEDESGGLNREEQHMRARSVMMRPEVQKSKSSTYGIFNYSPDDLESLAKMPKSKRHEILEVIRRITRIIEVTTSSVGLNDQDVSQTFIPRVTGSVYSGVLSTYTVNPGMSAERCREPVDYIEDVEHIHEICDDLAKMDDKLSEEVILESEMLHFWRKMDWKLRMDELRYRKEQGFIKKILSSRARSRV